MTNLNKAICVNLYRNDSNILMEINNTKYKESSKNLFLTSGNKHS